MVGVITAALTGATAGLTAAVASDHSLAAALSSGIVVALAAVVILMRSQVSAFKRAAMTPLLTESDSHNAQ
jgi:uncharacterized membrane protein YqgA involved in biofilm formation